jgi:CubicO group peptidase (beta-lactamase class C family)
VASLTGRAQPARRALWHDRYVKKIMLCLALYGGIAGAATPYPPEQFADPGRIAKLKSGYAAVDAAFARYAQTNRIPGMVWGIVVDDHLEHFGSAGVRDLESQTPLTAQTVFRIASMTKSFTTLAILKLRDAGRLSLEDPVAKWLPEFAAMPLPTRDSAPLTVRQLLSHSAGFPEDNPWGDQQLAASDADLSRWLRAGIPFSTPPGTRYEYSNYAFGLLGRIVAVAAGIPYETYVRREILAKLKMSASTLEPAAVPAPLRAVGYRLTPDGTYLAEAPLPQGAFGAAGGMLTSADDLAKYIAFHLAAWPPRDAPETGPVRRSSVREMAHMWTPANLTTRRIDGKLVTSQTGYGYGLRTTGDCRFEHIVSHGGGLPGFGSYMAWLPDYGVGIFAMATLTYSGPAEAVNQGFDALLSTGGLVRRELPPSPALLKAREQIWELWQHWDDAKARAMASMNLFLDAPVAQRRAEIEQLKSQVGACSSAGAVRAENWLRGQVNLSCENGTVGIFYTLSPTQPPAVQHLAFRRLEAESVRMGAPTGAPAGVSCSE